MAEDVRPVSRERLVLFCIAKDGCGDQGFLCLPRRFAGKFPTLLLSTPAVVDDIFSAFLVFFFVCSSGWA